MDADLMQNVAFHLTGRRAGAALETAEGLVPALLARHLDVDALRHDFPVVLPEGGKRDAMPLSSLMDEVLASVAQGDDALRLRQHGLRLERAIRARASAGPRTTLAAAWAGAEKALGDSGDPLVADSLARLRAARKLDGDLLPCDPYLAQRFVEHEFRVVEARRARAVRAAIGRLVLGLQAILRADEANSAAAFAPQRLSASVGGAFSDTFDFGALSRLLGERRRPALPERRRARIEDALATLVGQPFFGGAAAGDAAYEFVFTSCAGATVAWRERLPRMLRVARAMAVARLEIDGAYRDEVHDALFDALAAPDSWDAELARFPRCLVVLRANALAGEEEAVSEAFAAGLPFKVLLVTDDLVTETDGRPAFDGAAARGMAHAAIGIGGVSVVQAAASHLVRMRPRVARALEVAGPALVSVYSGAAGAVCGLPTYVAAAAAVESRAFPLFAYDPSAGADWSQRSSVVENPQAERDWPLHTLRFEDESLQSGSADVEFTLADFLAADRRFASRLAVVPRTRWNDSMVPVAGFAADEPQGLPRSVPCLFMTDRRGALRRVVADASLVRETRRARDRWRSLQELGGIRNSHAERLLARERAAWEEKAKALAQANGHAAEAAPAPAAPAAAAASPATTAPAPVAVAAPPARDPDEPWIETPRCSTCNECTRINDRMFKYDANKQAFIADASAGTYAQLVEAAESCQIAIIHPGKPKNPAEPNLDALLKRAEAFA